MNLKSCGMPSALQKEQGLELWGKPTSVSEVRSLFSRFCEGTLKALPWSDEPTAAETSIITKHLARINELGFLTINSQPAVNGAPSNDRAFGWGPANGFVYQKVSLEFLEAFSVKRPPYMLLIDFPATGLFGVLRFTRDFEQAPADHLQGPSRHVLRNQQAGRPEDE